MYRSESSFVLPVWPQNIPAGSADRTQLEVESYAPPLNFKQTRNVSQPTLAAFLPEPGKTSGTAVNICPGGAFHALAIDHEGEDVARWFVQHGLAAFVLNYHLVPTPARDDDHENIIQALLIDIERATRLHKPPHGWRLPMRWKQSNWSGSGLPSGAYHPTGLGS